MTPLQVRNRISKIEQAIELKFFHEAFIRIYFLNVTLLKTILKKHYQLAPENLKAKQLIDILIEQQENVGTKKIIANKFLKNIKSHFINAEVYFKKLKQSEQKNLVTLINEAKYCLSLMNIALNKK